MGNNLSAYRNCRIVNFFIFYFSLFIAFLCFPQWGSAAGRADEIVAKLAAEFRAMKSYEVTFTITAGENILDGAYAVEGERYYLTVGDAEVFGDGKIRYEVDNRRREVTISGVDNASRNILNNPVHAFDFLGLDYKAALGWERDGKAAVTLTPTSSNAGMSGTATVTVSTATMLPVALDYDYEGERVAISIDRIGSLSEPLKTFSKSAFPSYEVIDFR